MSASAAPKLVACIGAKTSPVLLGHFVAHYRALGISDFLVIFHAAPGDPRRDVMRRGLADLAIEPVLEIGEYSAPRKQRHSAEVVRRHCAPESWVLYADVDELQVYPADLDRVLADSARRGHRFVRGRLVDRLAPGGELVEIRSSPPIWDQFPVRGSVTSLVSGGWDRKVCAARASVPLDDGGAHAVDYGFSARWNYRLTHRWPRWPDHDVEVHHFKWDATLEGRVREKLEGAGGDRDAVEGASFLTEYRLLERHLREHGRIRLS